MSFRLSRLSAVVLFLMGSHSVTAFSQPQITPRGQDLSRTIRLWISGGLGPGSFHGAGDGITARASGMISVNRAVAMLRTSGSIEGFDGHSDHAEKSLLGGVRLGGKNLYLIPAIGVGNARWTNDYCSAHAICTPEEAAQLDARGRVVAFDIGVHASKLLAGLAVNVSGVAGGEKTDLLAIVISLELGAFGR